MVRALILFLANGAFTMTKWEPGSVAEFEKK